MTPKQTIGDTRQENWRFWIDRGGTFTDIVARRPDGRTVTHKLLSENPERYPDAAIQGIRDLLGLDTGQEIPAQQIDVIKMGTTVGTNALLERKGEPVLLAITKGFKDALRIGYQNRPRLFDLNIQLPEQLYQHVVEVSERIGADGSIVTPLDIAATKAALQQAYVRGLRAIAICFMHGYRYHSHERQVAELAAAIGFTQISTGHQTSPLMKLVSRGDTTVVDAYLSPILRHYVDQVAGAVQGARLMFMQSSGGLTDASLFQGRDCILSGPAGGVVGAVKTTELAGFTRMIGFDMGGTSTDVSHYAGAYERAFDTEVAGIRMRAPMMHIHTVAAGGGSILHFEDNRFQVGPDSAGADPGPACYRRGGPLTVTDCNVMLGKLQPQFFPAIFGPQADQPLDSAVVVAKFSELQEQIFTATGKRLSNDQIADGFLRIAVENMANAIKKISIQRGYDVSEYVLSCFGGAGGQHACLVADALGIRQVFLHPYAGVLSAYGMGLADVAAMREQAVEAALSETSLKDIETILASLSAQTTESLVAQDVAADRITLHCHLHMRYEGTDTALEIAYADLATLRQSFEAAHQQRFGFTDPAKTLIVEAVSVEATGGGENLSEIGAHRTASDRAAAIAQVEAHMAGGRSATPVYERQDLIAGQTVDGPAIIIEATGTTVVEPGWQAQLSARDDLILTRIQALANEVAVGTDVDPVMLEIFNNLFMSIAEQMGLVLANTAHSVNIKERLDFSCAVFDRDGELIANAPHMPVHLGSMSESVKSIHQQNAGKMRPGDAYMLNAPYNGGTHLPDVTVVTPVFDDAGDECLFYVASRGHHADIGGISPGSMPPFSRTVEEEGILLDNVKLIDHGRFLEAETRQILAAGPYPSRNIDNNIADLKAQAAACEKGVQELRRVVAHFGLDVVHAYMAHVQNNAEESVRRVIDVLSDGEFVYPMDDGSQIAVAVSIDRQARAATVDFTGTSAQLQNNYNAPTAVCRAAVLYVFRSLVDADIPLNAGCLKPIQLIIPEGSMLNPQYPAAVVAGNVETSQCITDALFGALGVLAGAQGTMNNFTFGDERWQYYETICGGAGAGRDFDGASAVHTHMTNSRLTDPEILEWRFPVRLEDFHIRRGSGGQGRHHGGDGTLRRIRFLQPMTASILSSHRLVAPFGLAGGEAGEVGKNWLETADGRRQDLKGRDQTDIAAGDVIVIQTPSGGGYGNKGAMAKDQ